ncbi:hypothetical protein CEXT_42231 [Caerostris extrusa]|uniref:Uncharacterized protein n=1 Tax=Caerostris extrusa TaxID=172846 RepID=A0AAV4PSI9_CAEEX|nr:hypothetical protein CEXT_42231 [Caerostris extrusa]
MVFLGGAGGVLMQAITQTPPNYYYLKTADERNFLVRAAGTMEFELQMCNCAEIEIIVLKAILSAILNKYASPSKSLPSGYFASVSSSVAI